MIYAAIPDGNTEGLISPATLSDGDLLIYATSLVRSIEQLNVPLNSPDLALEWVGREPKAGIDQQINNALIDGLAKTGLPILSEELENHIDWRSTSRFWIIDPLDGTLNYVRGSGPCAIAVSLWNVGVPVFGVILDIASREIAWGSKAGGGYFSTEKLAVSHVSDINKAVICTGIPANFDFSDNESTSSLLSTISLFGKVRMIGSAASSLLLVARGAVDCYFEDEIKIWDVAAGIAIVESAGGSYTLTEGKTPISVKLVASNQNLAKKIAAISTTNLS